MPARSMAVIGAGNMGSGIAQKIATEGYPVVLVDLDAAAVERGMARIRNLLDEAMERRIFTLQQVQGVLSRITPASDLRAVRECAIVIEAVFEDLEVKRDLFRRLDETCSPTTILATNTSSFYVRDLAAVTRRADRVLGLHYFYHPAKNRLVEIIPTAETSEAARTAAWTFNEVIGKTPIHSGDAPGFVVNRYFVPWLNEAVRLLEEGVADIPTIEAAAKEAFRIGMGPFELMNVTGVPITLHASTTLGKTLGSFYAPAKRLQQQIDSGANWPTGGEPDASRFAAVRDRLLGVVFYVAAQLVDEGVASIEDTDIGARVGLRWALGPFELMNRAGMRTAHALVGELLGRYESLKMPRRLAQQAEANVPFEFELVRCRVEDGLAEITLNRPDAMNALNEALVEQLARAFDAVDARDDVRTIVLRGAGKAFVAGADIRFFVKNIESGDFARIRKFTQSGQELFRRIDQSNKHVIVRLDGLSLGGGSELALCADTIVATDKGSLGFPETGIGIYPGLGGTQRTQRRCGVGLARYLVLTGQIVGAERAKAMGLVDELVSPDAIDRRVLELHRSGKRGGAQLDLDPELSALQDFFESADVEQLLSGEVASKDDVIVAAAGKIRHKAPLACKLADRMIRTGQQRGIEAGLALELEQLESIFRSADALEGLRSLGRRRPQFIGS